MNKYIIGDNLELLKKVPENKIDMIYMDPPYATGRNFYYFDDKFSSIQSFISEFLTPRFKIMHKILKKDGNLIVHIEPSISHYVKVCLDEIFGENNFKNEIIWSSGGNKTSKKQLARFHDVILVYSKSNKSKYFPQYIPYDENYKKKLKWCAIHKDYYSTTAAHNSQPEVNPRPNLRYEFNGHTKQWYISKEKMEKFKKEDRLEFSGNGIPRIKRFLKELKGKPVSDLWTDINQIQSVEKLPYATQKPIKLLERILELYSEKNDLVLDPFAGSGTVGRACLKLGRKYLLFDINKNGKRVFENSIKSNAKSPPKIP